MRNPIIKGSLFVALAYLPVLGCGGGNSEESNGVDDGKGGGGGSAASSGRGGTIGNGGTLIIGGTTGNGGGSGTTGNGGSGGGCVEGSRQGNKATVALYFMVDISGSMNCPVPEADPACETDPGNDPTPSRWTEASQAYKDFFGSSAASGLWAGISFFSGNSCDADNYGPDVEIAALPGNASVRGHSQAMVLDGKPAETILRVAEDEHVRLIVMGVESRGLIDRLLFGSTTREVIHFAGCPVLSIRADKNDPKWMRVPERRKQPVDA